MALLLWLYIPRRKLFPLNVEMTWGWGGKQQTEHLRHYMCQLEKAGERNNKGLLVMFTSFFYQTTGIYL